MQILHLKNKNIAKRVHEISIQAYRVEATYLEVDSFPPLKETYASLQESDDIFCGHYLGETLVGVLAYSITDNTLHIHRVVVDPTYFHQGIASALLSSLIQTFPEKDMYVTTGEKNIPAISLYERFAFAPYKQRDTTIDICLIEFKRLHNAKRKM